MFFLEWGIMILTVFFFVLFLQEVKSYHQSFSKSSPTNQTSIHCINNHEETNLSCNESYFEIPNLEKEKSMDRELDLLQSSEQPNFTVLPVVRSHVNIKEKEFVDKVLRMIEDMKDCQEFDVPFMYDKLCMSRSLFFSKFKRLTGTTPYSQLIKARLNHSIDLLVSNPFCSISEIAYLSGFSNPVYFSKSFKKRFGMSPVNYRKLHMVNSEPAPIHEN